MISDSEKQQLAQVFAAVLRPFMDDLKKEFVLAAVEILDQQAKDFAKIMEAQNQNTIGKMIQQKERVESERSREENRLSEMMLEGLRK